MAEISATTALQVTQGRVQESPAAGRVIPFPQVPGRNSAHTEARTFSRATDSPTKTTGVAPTGGVALGFVGGTILQLVADQQQSGDGLGGRSDRLVRLRAVAAYETASEVGEPPRTADGGKPVARPGASFDFLA